MKWDRDKTGWLTYLGEIIKTGEISDIEPIRFAVNEIERQDKVITALRKKEELIENELAVIYEKIKTLAEKF
jgi:hypothetical protein